MSFLFSLLCCEKENSWIADDSSSFHRGEFLRRSDSQSRRCFIQSRKQQRQPALASNTIVPELRYRGIEHSHTESYLQVSMLRSGVPAVSFTRREQDALQERVP